MIPRASHMWDNFNSLHLFTLPTHPPTHPLKSSITAKHKLLKGRTEQSKLIYLVKPITQCRWMQIRWFLSDNQTGRMINPNVARFPPPDPGLFNSAGNITACCNPSKLTVVIWLLMLSPRCFVPPGQWVICTVVCRNWLQHRWLCYNNAVGWNNNAARWREAKNGNEKYPPHTNTCPRRKGGGDPQPMKPDMCSRVPSTEAGLSRGEVLFWVPISTFTSQVRLHLLHHRGLTWGLGCSCCDSYSTCKTRAIPWEVPQRRMLQKRAWGVFGFKRDRRRVKLFPLQLPHRTEIWRLKCGGPSKEDVRVILGSGSPF